MSIRPAIPFIFSFALTIGLLVSCRAKRLSLDTSTPSGFLVNALLSSGGKPSTWPIYQLSQSYSTSDGTMFLGNASGGNTQADALLITKDGSNYTTIPIEQPAGNYYQIDLAGAYSLNGITSILLAFYTTGSSNNTVVRISKAAYVFGTTTAFKTDDTTQFTDLSLSGNTYTNFYLLGVVGGNVFVQGITTSGFNTYYTADNFGSSYVAVTPTYSCTNPVVNAGYLVCGTDATNSTTFGSWIASTPPAGVAQNSNIFGDATNLFKPGLSSGSLSLVGGNNFSGSTLTTTAVATPPAISSIQYINSIQYLGFSSTSALALIDYTDTSNASFVKYSSATGFPGPWSTPQSFFVNGVSINFIDTAFLLGSTAYIFFFDPNAAPNTTPDLYMTNTTDGVNYSTFRKVIFPYNGP